MRIRLVSLLIIGAVVVVAVAPFAR
jgi:hypothetical protein